MLTYPISVTRYFLYLEDTKQVAYIQLQVPAHWYEIKDLEMKMKTVRDIYVDVLAMKKQGVKLNEIINCLEDIANDNGFTHTRVRRGSNAYELQFPDGEQITFDGNEWRHLRP